MFVCQKIHSWIEICECHTQIVCLLHWCKWFNFVFSISFISLNAYCECKFLNRKLAVLTMKESFIFWIHHQIRLNSMYDLYYHHHPNKTTGILLNKNKTEKIVNFNNEKIREPNKKEKEKEKKPGSCGPNVHNQQQ